MSAEVASSPGTGSAADERVEAVWAHLRALAPAEAYAYPDRDNKLEDMVFTFQKRKDEARVWGELLNVFFGTARPVEGLALDAGCGLGGHAPGMLEHFRHPLFIDADAARVAELARRMPELKTAVVDFAGTDWARGPAEGAFRFIQCVQVFGHLPTRVVEGALAHLARALAPGGALLLGVPFTGAPMDDFWITYLDVAERPQPMQTDVRKYDRLAERPEAYRLPVRHFSVGTLVELVGRVGLEPVVHKPYNWFSDVRGDLFLLAKRPG